MEVPYPLDKPTTLALSAALDEASHHSSEVGYTIEPHENTGRGELTFRGSEAARDSFMNILSQLLVKEIA